MTDIQKAAIPKARILSMPRIICNDFGGMFSGGTRKRTDAGEY